MQKIKISRIAPIELSREIVIDLWIEEIYYKFGTSLDFIRDSVIFYE